MILAVVMLLSFHPITVKAEAYWPEGPVIETPSAIVMEVNSGAVLYEKNSDVKNYPASITPSRSPKCPISRAISTTWAVPPPISVIPPAKSS